MIHVKYPLVEVIWNDAATDDNEWKQDSELGDEDELVLTVGFLVKETAKFLWIASSIYDDYSNNRNKIPKGMVVEVKTIKEADSG